MATSTLDPSRFTLTVIGVQVMGVAPDTFFKFTMEGDQIIDEAGGRGDVTRIINLDQRATVEVTLQQSSPTNDYFSTLLNADLRGLGGSVGPVSLKDLNGTTSVDAQEGWVMKFADAELGAKPYTRVWKIRLAKARVTIGGSVV